MSYPVSSPLRVIGIGASAGGIEPLLKVLAELPEDFPHGVLVVVHLPARGHSVLADIIERHCSLHVLVARHMEIIRAGHAYVALPDFHLTAHDRAIAITSGPQENSFRPAIDPLFRSLAVAYGPAAVAVVLSGALGDGASGALAVSRAGGRVLVQDPEEAIVPSMPRRAIAETAGAAEVLGAAAIGARLARMEPPPEIAVRPLAGVRS